MTETQGHDSVRVACIVRDTTHDEEQPSDDADDDVTLAPKAADDAPRCSTPPRSAECRELESTFGEPPCDFAVHIAQRLGLDLEAAQATLCEWLHRYRPENASRLANRFGSG